MPTDMNVTYTIVLSDETKLTNISLNGNNFVSKTEITEDIFEGRLSKITVIDNESSKQYVMHNVRLLQIQTYPDIPDLPGWYFVLQEIPQSELEMMKIKANMEYLAMMSDCEL